MGTWRSHDYDARGMVKALKGESFKGSFSCTHGGVQKTFNEANGAGFIEIARDAMWHRLDELMTGRFTLVPIPNSHVVDEDAPGFRTLELARAIESVSGGRAAAVPALVFTSPQPKSHQGGSRDPVHLHSVMKQTVDLVGDVVLIDDVFTRGAHFKAATWRLEGNGARVILGATFARASHDTDAEVFGFDDVVIDATRPFFLGK